MSQNKENNILTESNVQNRKGNQNRKSLVAEKGAVKGSVPVTDKLSNYVNYVKNLESQIEILMNESNNLTESKNIELEKITKYYESEIGILRKYLNESSCEQFNLSNSVLSMKEELESYKVKLIKATESNNKLLNYNEELEKNEIVTKRKLTELENIKNDFKEISYSNERNAIELKKEIRKRGELENEVKTLEDEIEFLRSLNNNCNITQNSINTSVTNTDKVKELEVEFEHLKDQLICEFEQRESHIQGSFKTKIEEMNNINGKLSDKYKSAKSELKSLSRDYKILSHKLEEKDAEIGIMKNKIAQQSNTLSELNEEHENYIKHLADENETLQNTVREKVVENSIILNEKMTIEQELFNIRNLLEGERSRCSFDTTSAKKRKMNFKRNSGCEFIISARSNDKIKMACDENYQGDYIWILNDCVDEVDLNGWKLKIINENGDVLESIISITINSKQMIKLWSCNQDTTEDECNFKLKLQLPVNEKFECSLINDMNEIEASFDLKRLTITNKPILTAKRHDRKNNKECNIM